MSAPSPCRDGSRKITVQEHHDWQLRTFPPADDIDEALANPIHDHRPQTAAKHKVRGVLGILNQLDEVSNREGAR